MSSISEEYMSGIIKKVSTACNLKYVRYSREKFESIGQNYFGIIIPIILLGKNDDQEEVVKKLVLKLAPTDERYRISGAVTAFFAREIFAYTRLFVEYEKLQKHLPSNKQFIIPRCYYAYAEHCKEIIAMQDMSVDGYRPYLHNRFLDFAHIALAMKSLAKLHALSFILKERAPVVYDEVSKVCVPFTITVNKRYMDILTDRLSKAISKFERNHHEYLKLFIDLKENCANYFDKAIELVHCMCISHGDVWKENILFKYQNDLPTSACLIDYQTNRMSSPAFDVLYLIISSTNTDLRLNNYHNFLNIYYQTFNQMLKQFDLDSQLLYSMQSFLHDLKIVAPACFITANCALWLSNGLQEEGHVRSKHTFKSQKEKEIAECNYIGTVKAIIDDFYKYLYFENV